MLLWEIKRNCKWSVKCVFVKTWNLQSAFWTEIVHSQNYSTLIHKSLFTILHFINVISLFMFNITFLLYPFFCRAFIVFSFQSYLTSVITKASVKRLWLRFSSKWLYLLSTTFWKKCEGFLYLIFWTHSWSL